MRLGGKREEQGIGANDGQAEQERVLMAAEQGMMGLIASPSPNQLVSSGHPTRRE